MHWCLGSFNTTIYSTGGERGSSLNEDPCSTAPRLLHDVPLAHGCTAYYVVQRSSRDCIRALFGMGRCSSFVLIARLRPLSDFVLQEKGVGWRSNERSLVLAGRGHLGPFRPSSFIYVMGARRLQRSRLHARAGAAARRCICTGICIRTKPSSAIDKPNSSCG